MYFEGGTESTTASGDGVGCGFGGGDSERVATMDEGWKVKGRRRIEAIRKRW